MDKLLNIKFVLKTLNAYLHLKVNESIDVIVCKSII